jgi:hypothetical protein
MPTFIDKFIEQLIPYTGKIVIHPLLNEEINALEDKVNKKLPDYYKEFLAKVGLKQDVIWGLNDRIKDFVPLDGFLPEDQAYKFFRFGHDGGEEYWLLRTDDPSDDTIYEFNYDTDQSIVNTGRNFKKLLEDAIIKLEKNKHTLVDNALKIWPVQFSIRTMNEQLIINAINNSIACKMIRALETTQVSAAGLICAEGEMQVGNVKVKLMKHEHEDWSSPLYYFDWIESIEEMKRDSKVHKILTALRSDKLDVNLVEYGIMNKNDRMIKKQLR